MWLKQVSPRGQALISKAKGFICYIFLLDECFYIFYITVKTAFIPNCWEGRMWLRRYKRWCQNRDEKTSGNQEKHFMELPLKKKEKSWCLFCLCFYLFKFLSLFCCVVFMRTHQRLFPWASLQIIGFLLSNKLDFERENCEIGAGYSSLFVLAVRKFRVRSVDTSHRETVYLHSVLAS